MRERDLIADWLVERVGALTEVDPDTIPWDMTFIDIGLSTVEAVELSEDLQRWTDLELPPTLCFDYPTIEAVAKFVAAEAAREGRSLSLSRARAREGAVVR